MDRRVEERPAEREGNRTGSALTAHEAAAWLGVAERTVRRAIARGDLRAVKRSGAFRIAPDDLERFRRQRADGRGPLAAVAPDPALPPAPVPPAPIPFPDRAARVPERLPVPPTSFVGREHELAVLATSLRRADDRLLTLTGPGGVGKTRLALEAAAAVGDAFPDGVLFVHLASVHDPDLVAAAVARTLGLRETGVEPLPFRLRSYLRDQRLLLVLDNFEQVVEAAPLVSALLAACPHLKALVTSRVRLRVSGERERAVPPLGLVAGRADLPENDGVAASDAVRLFVERVRALRPDFVLDGSTAPAVAEICRRVDGLPLGIELAVARLRHLSLESLLGHLERRLPLLVDGPRDAPDRLRTMRAAVAWSHDLLGPGEQALFRRLAVFAGGFTLEAAEAVCAEVDAPRIAVFDGVTALVDASLLQPEEAVGGPRYRMLETIREFGLEMLEVEAQGDGVRARHAAWYLGIAAGLTSGLAGPDTVRRHKELADERDNLRAALAWLIDSAREDDALELAGSLLWYWHSAGHLHEGRRWLERALALGAAATSARVAALLAAGVLAHAQGDDARAGAFLDESLALARALNDLPGIATAIARLAVVAEDAGDFERARPLLDEALVRFRDLGDQPAVARTLNHLGVVTRGRGDEQRAVELWEEAVALQRACEDSVGLAISLHWLGLHAGERGDHARAAALHAEGLRRRWAAGAVEGIPFALADIAVLASACGRPEPAAGLFGAAEAARETIGRTVDQPERGIYERAAAAARTGLGEPAFAAAWATGREMVLPAAIAEAEATARDIANGNGRPEPGNPPAVAVLTPREREVLRLLASGADNRAIAARLSISPATVARHVANLYGKLGVDSRARAAALAYRLGLA